MNIALDYDDTYTKDDTLWDYFIDIARVRGHMVYIVTARHPEKDKINWDFEVPVIYCNGVAKQFVLYHDHGIDIDIWIDDRPETILENSKATKEWLTEWRKTRIV